ncbi:phage baseplate assembly protein V [Micromonospora endophytica]|uniref:Baseplate assembly protein n=1 Tax=Micromonospora endophytica TaxID=515350 RepID=A0A2W2DB52_9ACTN|nr:phage baseplate assembly protein V [Micromonospora endophytica]PZF98019.1 baseplate assembly protein [Micromonospora endophytica]RIW49854.1 baseplate assembly protein [Micromonospora endophytica]BCJ57212.1 baseplate assembly protein [Micromonospora endophytica]
MPGRFLGKFRGTVTDTRDPLGEGRIQVSVPEVLGEHASWALPCVPYAGPGVGLLAAPPVGTRVWVEFEAGSPDRPIWVGCFWGRGEYPTTVPAPAGVVLRIGEVTLVTVDPRAQGPAPVPAAADGTQTTELTLTGGQTVLWQGGQPALTVNREVASLTLANLAATLSATQDTVVLRNRDTSVALSATTVSINDGALEVS